MLDERANRGTGLPTSALISDKSLLHSGAAGPVHDPEQARRLVAEVVAEGGWDGSIRLSCQDTPTAAARAQAIEAMLETVGFTVDVTLSATVIADVTVHANYDLACWGLNINDASAWAALDQYRSDSARNITGYGDPRMDAALAELRVASGVEAQAEVLAEIQEIWNETAPSFVYETIEELIAWRPEVRGLTFNLETVVYFDDAYLVR